MAADALQRFVERRKIGRPQRVARGQPQKHPAKRPPKGFRLSQPPFLHRAGLRRRGEAAFGQPPHQVIFIRQQVDRLAAHHSSTNPEERRCRSKASRRCVGTASDVAVEACWESSVLP
jgi:hypothetical protein